MARLFELTLICAGHYADSCEFSAAGDLPVNPRKILVHRKGNPLSWVKKRHSELSEQLNVNGACREHFLLWFKHEVTIEIVKPALLAYLFERIESSERIVAWYLHSAQERMKRISDTIGFLSAWFVSSCVDLHQRMKDPKVNRFVTAHLCHFDTHLFERLGLEIQRLLNTSSYSCKYLTY